MRKKELYQKVIIPIMVGSPMANSAFGMGAFPSSSIFLLRPSILYSPFT